MAEVVLDLDRRLNYLDDEESDMGKGMRIAYRIAFEKLKECFEM
ncbi:hypothetical protein P9209_30275 (plasmid) [Prescottella defluvii]|nr:hypothetical protein P9209_30275 [Prescottella defluvii]